MLRRVWVCGLVGLAGVVQAAEPALIELKTSKQAYQGRRLAHDDQVVCLVEPSGKLQLVETARVESFRKVGAFTPLSQASLRDQLRRELGSGFEVVGTGGYLVAARPGHAARYGQVFEDIFRSFQTYFNARGFRLNRPEFPLVAIVFSDQQAFARYASQDGVQAGRGLLGYYYTMTNRVALFESAPRTSQHGPNLIPLALAPAERARSPFTFAPPAAGTIDGNLEETIIHETTHQVAYNTGLHPRIGQNPRWVVEGLATVFEAPGIRNPGAAQSPSQRINPDRYMWFGNYHKARRPAKSLQAFVTSDKPFETAPLDAYAEAWAFTFFLLETRSSKYAAYLKLIQQRPPLAEYTAAQRLADFQQAFGSDVPLLEAAFLRHFDGLAAGLKGK